jgi:hypothetical protein
MLSVVTGSFGSLRLHGAHTCQLGAVRGTRAGPLVPYGRCTCTFLRFRNTSRGLSLRGLLENAGKLRIIIY